MKAQLKYSFKKESALFFRRYHLLAMVLAIFGFAIANPLMCKAMNTMVKIANEMHSPTQTAQIAASPDGFVRTAGAAGLDGMMGMFRSAAVAFSYSLIQFATYSLLIIMLAIRSAAGGEQKKRAMIVPLCSGLQNKDYLIPKFVIYPLATFVLTFLGGLTAGGLCNALFELDRVSFGMVAFGALIIAVYIAFIVTVYLSLGICTSRPGLMVGAVFLGQMFLQSFLDAMHLSDYQPFTLLSAAGSIFTAGEDFDLSRKLPSIYTAMGLCVVIGVLMFFLALGVLNAKRIDNTEEDKPAF